MTATLPPEAQSRLSTAFAHGQRAWWDGYPIIGTCHPVGTIDRTAFENGWTRARDKAVAEGMAMAGADNSQYPNSR